MSDVGLPQKDVERIKVLCQECGYSKDIPAKAVPASGARATCPKCACKIIISSPVNVVNGAANDKEAGASEKEAATEHVAQPPISAKVKFKTFSAYDNRFKGKGDFCIENDHVQVNAKRRLLSFAFGRETERYPVSSIRNASCKGKVVQFAVPLGKGQWQALLVCDDEVTAKNIAERLPDTVDSDLYTAQQANRELKDRLAQLPGGKLVTWTLLALNIFIYLAIAYTTKRWAVFDAGYLSTVGANFFPLTTDGQWWRLLTATFLHNGLFHLLFNLFGLYIFGGLVEKLYGSMSFLTVYLLAGVVGSCGTLLFSPESVGVGASGAVFGVIGVIVFFLGTDRDFLTTGARKRLFTNFAFYGIYTLINGFGKGGIDNAAHVGGLLAGLAMAWSIGTPVRLKKDSTGWLPGRVVVAGSLVLLCAGAAVAAAPKLSDDYKVHVEMIELLREVGEKEIRLGEAAKSLGVKGAKVTSADIEKVVMQFKTGYDGYMERISVLQPSSQALKARKDLASTYISLKKEGCLIMAQGLESNDEKMVEDGSRKLEEANKLVVKLSNPVKWYR